MNILIFLHQDTFIGGAESVLLQITQHYLSQGAEVHVWFLMPKKFGHWEKEGAPNLHLHYGRGLWKMLKNINELKKIRFDYSFSSLVDFTGTLGLLRRLHILHIKRMIGRESTSIFDRYKGLGLLRKKMMYRLGYPAVDVLICQTSYMKEQLLKHLPWIANKRRVVVIPNPVDLKAMKLKGEETIDTKRYEPYIVTAGRFIPEKGYDVLINAYDEILKSHPELQLVILGDGELRQIMEHQIEKLGLKERIHLPGFSKNVYPWFKAAKLCVISSSVEGFPNVLLQMMSQNGRVVSTLCAGDIECIKGLHTCAPNNVNALAEAINEALNSENEKKNRQLFDEELAGRAIERFIEAIEKK